MTISEHVSLAEYTTFKIGGPARYFCVVKSIEELREALEFAKSKSQQVFVLGGGSNILAGDAGFDGLVIKMEMKGVVREGSLVTAWAGEGWDDLVAKTVEWNMWGLENLSLIPGTVGASPVQNIGAYGVEVMDVIESVRTIDIETGAEKVFSNAECGFSYRDSFFKKPEAKKYIIVSVTFSLRLGGQGDGMANLSYKDIKAYFATTGVVAPSQAQVRGAVISIRTGKFPNLSTTGTAGSFWKNPIISKEQFARISAAYPLIPSFPVDGEGTSAHVKVPLAWVLDNVCGLKGFKMGLAGLFEKQPLVLVAEKGASSKDVNRLADFVARTVKDKTGIEIEREVGVLYSFVAIF